MAQRYKKEEIIDDFRKEISARRLVLVTTAGIGISAKYEQLGGADMIAVTYSSILGMDGNHPVASMLPYGNANDYVINTIKRVAPLVKNVPLLAGICATDPTTDLNSFMDRLLFHKVAAVTNMPSIGILGREICAGLEKFGINYRQEVEMLAAASAKGFFTAATIYDINQAEMMSEIHPDMMICSLGITEEPEDSQAVENMQMHDWNSMISQVRKRSPESIILLHGGCLSNPVTAERVLRDIHAEGLFLSSAVERIPVQRPLQAAVEQFKSAPMKGVKF